MSVAGAATNGFPVTMRSRRYVLNANRLIGILQEGQNLQNKIS